MRKFMLAVISSVALLMAPVAANAQGFVVGMVVGGMLFGGNTQYGSSGGMVLYSADEDVLKKVDPMKVRLVSYLGCFAKDDGSVGKSMEDMFLLEMKVLKKQPEQQRILQIVRVFAPDSSRCASIWFAYVDKNDAPGLASK